MVTEQLSTEKRQILSAATFRFASPLQGLRENSLEKLITKLLFDIDHGDYVDVGALGEAFSVATHGGHLDRLGILEVIERLQATGYVEEFVRESGKFRLTKEVRDALGAEESQFDRELNELLCRLYGCTSRKAKRYEKPFYAVIGLIAGSIGEESANQLINGRTESFVTSELISSAVEKVTGNYRPFDTREFQQGVVDFFRSHDPACHRVLWQLAESYFVTRLIGIDPSGRSLSREVVDKTEIVLDTNVILALLMESDENHGLVTEVLGAAAELGMPITVCDITLEELNRAINRQYEDLSKIVQRGGNRWLNRLDSSLIREFSFSGVADPDQFMSRYSHIECRLREDWSVEIDEVDPNQSVVDLETFAYRLQERYKQSTHSMRLKTLNVAMHDAEVICHIESRRVIRDSSVWLLTLDGSLPDVTPEGSEWSSLAIAPRSLVQWIAPVVARSSDEYRFATVFAEMVQAHFLPRSPFSAPRISVCCWMSMPISIRYQTRM